METPVTVMTGGGAAGEVAEVVIGAVAMFRVEFVEVEAVFTCSSKRRKSAGSEASTARNEKPGATRREPEAPAMVLLFGGAVSTPQY